MQERVRTWQSNHAVQAAAPRSARRFIARAVGLCGMRSKVDAAAHKIDRIDSTLAGLKNDLERRLMRLEERIAKGWQTSEISSLRILTGPALTNRIIEIGRMLRPMSVVGIEKVRWGCQHDGGYVMLNDLKSAEAVVSLGIGGNATWDADAAQHGLHVYQFDHTIAPPPQHPKFTFYQRQIVPDGVSGGATLSSIVNQIGANKPGSLILKIDIEDDEWPVFDAASIDTLRLFSQIVCEFHWLNRIVDVDRYLLVHRVLEKLNRWFAPVHVHANNFAELVALGGVPFPSVLEVTYANRDLFDLRLSEEIFPTPLDTPNDPMTPDYYLGRFQF